MRIHTELEALAGTADFNPESVSLPFIEANRRITIMRKGFAIEHIRPLDELTLRSDIDRDASRVLFLEPSKLGHLDYLSVLNIHWNVGHRHILERILCSGIAPNITTLRLEGGSIRAGIGRGWPRWKDSQHELNPDQVSLRSDREGTLISFLQYHRRLDEISLRRVTLEHVGWDSLLTFLYEFRKSKFARLKSLTIENAFEKDLPVLYQGQVEDELPPDTTILFCRAREGKLSSNIAKAVAKEPFQRRPWTKVSLSLEKKPLRKWLLENLARRFCLLSNDSIGRRIKRA